MEPNSGGSNIRRLWRHTKRHVQEMVRTDMHRKQPDVTVRVVIVGDGAVGKSTLLARLRHGEIDEDEQWNCECYSSAIAV